MSQFPNKWETTMLVIIRVAIVLSLFILGFREWKRYEEEVKREEEMGRSRAEMSVKPGDLQK